MTVAVPERTAPTPPWRPPTDPLPLTATQPVSLCYHGNFSLSLVDNDSDVSDDVVDADSIRSILELAEQCALGISAKDTAHPDMYPNELTPPAASCDEATTTYQPCRFTAGVKRKLDFDSVDDETLGDSLTSREDGGEERVSDYMDQQRMLEVSLCKMRRMEDPETSLRRCVLINNMTVKLKRELDHHDQHCRPMLPKKRHAFRRVDSISIPPDVAGLTAPHNPGCRYDSYRGGLRRTLDDAFEKTGFSQCKESADGLRDGLELPMRHNKCTSMESDRGDAAADGDGDRADGEAPSIFGDIDNVFQSLLSCLGEPM